MAYRAVIVIAVVVVVVVVVVVNATASVDRVGGECGRAWDSTRSCTCRV